MATGELDLLGPITRDNTLAVEMSFGPEVFLATWAQVLSPSGTNIQAPPDLNGMVVGMVGDTFYSRQVRKALKGFDVNCRFVEFRFFACILPI